MTLRQQTLDFAAALQATYEPAEAAAIAGLVLEHLLALTPLQRRMQAATPVPEATAQRLSPLLARLLAHEPVQYVLGVAYFADMELEVSPATLIPRPETEELLRLIETEQAGRAGLRVLDVGTGTGCLALALARHLPQSDVLAVDISAEALAVARRNAASHAPQVRFAPLDILTQTPDIEPGTLDVLVSNPPYVRESERALMRDNVLAWEPPTALFVPDDDPLLFYRRLAELGRELLRPGGGIYLEINEEFGAETGALLESWGFQRVRVVADMFGRNRMVRGTAPVSAE